MFVLISTFADNSVNVLSKVDEIRRAIENARTSGKIVGLVPTMGALHYGHVSLIRHALDSCDVVVVSIFVNPTQFNEPQDFQNYPRNLEADLEILRDAGCHLAFVPEFEDVYPEPDNTHYDFGHLETNYEGAHRPGHFRGVAMVVRRFFEIIQPDKAFFGLKDYQQVQVIQELVKQFQLNISIEPMPTIREKDGLAMSSRNRLLSVDQRDQAANIYRVLKEIREKAKNVDIAGLTKWVQQEIDQYSELELEYFGIAEPNGLTPIENLRETPHAIALIAVWAGNIRLIDNLQLF